MGSPAGKSYSGMHLSPATNCLVLYSCWGWFRRHKKWGEIYGSHPDPNKDTQLWNIWQCCILVIWDCYCGSGCWATKWMKQPSRFRWFWYTQTIHYYTQYSFVQIPIFPAQWLKHFALLQGFSWSMSLVWSGIRIIRIQWQYRQKVLWLCLKS